MIRLLLTVRVGPKRDSSARGAGAERHGAGSARAPVSSVWAPADPGVPRRVVSMVLFALSGIHAHGCSLAADVSSPGAALAIGAVLLLTGGAAAGCGASTPSTGHRASAANTTRRSSISSTTSSSTTDRSTASARRLEDALTSKTDPPRPASASCRPATAAERSTAPFGSTTLPVFVCLIANEGHSDTFDVQVLKNGCYVAERIRPGQAIYGCGARSSS